MTLSLGIRRTDSQLKPTRNGRSSKSDSRGKTRAERSKMAACALVVTTAILSLTSAVTSSTPSGATAVKAHGGSTCSQPGGDFAYGSSVVGIAGTHDGGGYWIVNNLGQVAACGDAAFYCQPASLNKPIVGISATNDGTLCVNLQ